MKNKKLIMLISVIVILLVSAILLFYFIRKENAIKEELVHYPRINERVDFDGLRIEKLEIEKEEEKAIVKGIVSNISSDTIELQFINIRLYDSNKELIVVTLGYIGETLEPKDVREFSTTVELNLSDAKYVKYEIVR